jgi:hypothetical protein
MTAVLRARFEKPGPASPAPSTARKRKSRPRDVRAGCSIFSSYNSEA